MCVRGEIRWETFVPVVVVHPFFFQYISATPAAMQELCDKALREVSLVQDEELFPGEKSAQHMVFVTRGKLRYFHPATAGGEKVKNIVAAGQWACEAALWIRRLAIFGPFAAETWTDTNLLAVAAFRQI